MKCFKCEHENTKGSKFCSNCGKDFYKKKQVEKETVKTLTYPNAEAIKLHEARLQEKAYNSTILWSIYIVILFLIFIFSAGSIGAFILGALFALAFVLPFILARKAVTPEYYYSLPGSKNSNGEHTCIFCGNKGIYRSTIYKTTTTVNACSKCKKTLFNT